MKLYYRPGACALAPHILLEHVQIDFEAVLAPAPAEFKDINPTGAVPAMVVSQGKTLSQCGAILQFICEVSGRVDLLGGSDPYRRAGVSKWTSFFTGDFHPAFFPIFAPQRYTTSTDDQVIADVKKAGQVLVRNGLSEIENRLGDTNYLGGDDLTICDFYAVPMLRWCTLIFPNGLKEWPETKNFYRVMANLEETQRALQAQGISA